MNADHQHISTDLVAEARGANTAVRIGGTLRPRAETSSSASLTLRSPIDGAQMAQVATGAQHEATQAVQTASQTFGHWSTLPAAERAARLRAVATDLLASADIQSWPTLITEETGKRVPEAQAELKLSATYFNTFADLIESQEEEHLRVAPGHEHTVYRRARGVVTVLTPWNFPVSIPARKIAPALAAGCTVVFKPSELGTLSSMVLAGLLDRHLPAGTVNTVLGHPSEVSDIWLDDPAVQAMSFTGSTRVGHIVGQTAMQRFLPSVLELGGCAPFVILPDAAPAQAVETLMVAKFRNNGQSCIAANQIFVAENLAGEVIERLEAEVSAIRAGDPRDESTDLGPMAPADDPQRLRDLVNEAIDDGARLAATGADMPANGHYAPPTLLVDVPDGSRVFTEEIFGPIAAVQTFTDIEDVITKHKATGYGLAGYVCSADQQDAQGVAQMLNAGIVGINTGTPNHPRVPFGGLGKSGLGYEGSAAGLEPFQSQHTIARGWQR